VKATLDSAGGMPMLRGAVESFAAIARLARWEGRRAERVADGPRRRTWPELAGTHVTWSADATPDPLSIEAASAIRGRQALGERESLALLAEAGLPVIPWRAVPADPDAVVAAWRELGAGPVAVKHDAEGQAHKSEAGGVALSLGDEPAILQAVARLCDAAARTGIALRGLLVQPMAPAGVELIVGGRRDPVVGPVVLAGLGGVLAEVLDDVAVSLAPVPGRLVRRDIEMLRGAPILYGARGRPGVDLDALAGLVSRLGDLLVDDPSILEIDLNPVIASADGVVAVDALVVRAAHGT
jgi:acetyl-CoA synthetase